MKNIKYIIAILTIILSFSSCTKDFDELSKDPVALEFNPNGQISFAQLSMSGDRFYQWRSNLIYPGGFVQHYSGSWAVGYGSIAWKNDGYAASLWDRAYSNEIKNIVDVIEKTKDDTSKNNVNAIARVVKVMIMQRVTDYYGDVPYSEAGKGFITGNITPKYDKQEDIYMDFFKELDIAYAKLSSGGDAVSGDLFYGGDTSKWKKLISSLRLRLGMRIAEVNSSEATKQVAKAFSDGVFDSNDDNCVLNHGDVAFDGASTDFRGNGFAQALEQSTGNGTTLSKLLTAFLRDNKDPRLTMLLDPRTAGAWGAALAPGDDIFVGFAPGYNWDFGGAVSASKIKDIYKKSESPFLHISYSETQLLLAEAAKRGFISGAADDFYKKGIESGIKQLEMYGADAASQADIDAYISSVSLKSGMEEEQIATQLWITYLFNSMEAYSNWRRTGFPKLIPINHASNVTGGVVPRRMYYPNGELEKNEKNYLDALKRLGGENDWLKKVWWDAK